MVALTTPLLSYGVVTVTRNVVRTIDKTIESVISQTEPPREYVFVDGSSTDGTLDRISKQLPALQQRGVRTKVVNQADGRGITNAWNRGLNELETDVAFILNGDDWYEPEAGAWVMTAFRRNPDAALILASGRYISQNGDRAPVICRPRPKWVLPVAMTVIHPACFVRRDVYRTIGNFDERYSIAADYEFIYRCIVRKLPMRILNKTVVNVLEGGAASKQRYVSRNEMAAIGLAYSRFPFLPHLAKFCRQLLDR